MEYCNSSNSIWSRVITIWNELMSEARFTLNLCIFCTSCVQPAVTDYKVNIIKFSDRGENWQRISSTPPSQKQVLNIGRIESGLKH